MDGKKCDRCGEFYINHPTAMDDRMTLGHLYLVKYNPSSQANKIMDLCYNCRLDLDEWLNKFKKEEE